MTCQASAADAAGRLPRRQLHRDRRQDEQHTGGVPLRARAIDPNSGRAISKYNFGLGWSAFNIDWQAHQRPTGGGHALLATPAGLWAGSDGTKINAENHLGLAFLPQ